MMSTKEFLKVLIDLNSNRMYSRPRKYLKKQRMNYIYLKTNNRSEELTLETKIIIILQVFGHLSLIIQKIIKILDIFQNLKIIMLS